MSRPDIHPAIIEQQQRDRDNQSHQIPLHIPAPQPYHNHNDDSPDSERGVVTIDNTIRPWRQP